MSDNVDKLNDSSGQQPETEIITTSSPDTSNSQQTNFEPPNNNPTIYAAPKKQPKKALNKKGLIILVCIIGIAIIASLFETVVRFAGGLGNNLSRTVHYTGFSGRPNYSINNSSVFWKTMRKPFIAVLTIEGTIEEDNNTYNQEYLLDSIDSLCCDENNKGILLYINSPGGTVYEADELYLALVDYKKQTNRPVWAYFGSMAASGGYYIGCAADTIIANRNTLTGSIGVIAGTAIDLTSLMDNYGIKTKTFTAGKNKNMLNFNSPITEEQTAIMQSVADDAYNQFTQIVSESRNLNIDVVKQLADGRVYTAKQAYENSLIDGINGFNEAYTMMNSVISDEPYELKIYQYKHKTTFTDFITGFSSITKNFVSGNLFSNSTSESFALQTALNQMYPDIKYPAYYYKQ